MELNKKFRIISWTLAFVVLFNITFAIFFIIPHISHPYRNMPHHPPRNNFMPPDKPMNLHREILDELDLNNTQIRQYNQFRQQFFEKTKVCFDSIGYYNQKIDEIITSDNPDKKAIDEYIKQIANCHIRIKQNSIQYYFNVKGILNDKQQKKFKKIYLEFRKSNMPPFCKQ